MFTQYNLPTCSLSLSDMTHKIVWSVYQSQRLKKGQDTWDKKKTNKRMNMEIEFDANVVVPLVYNCISVV